MSDIKIKNKIYEIRPDLIDQVARKQKEEVANNIMISAGPDKGTPLQFGDRWFGSDQTGKTYPGRLSYGLMRVMARNSSVVRAIINLRAQQIAKLPIKIVPKENEPPRQSDLLKYNIHDLEKHPAFREEDKVFMKDIFERIDPDGIMGDKRKKFLELKEKGEFTPEELSIIQEYRDQHHKFYRERDKDIEKIKKLLNKPDPKKTKTKSWNLFVIKMLEDILVMDRGTFFKWRDPNGDIIGLIPLDGATIRPVVNETGFVSDEKAYVQEVDRVARAFLKADDICVMMMYPKTDTSYFAYGESPLENLYTLVLTDLFIDKGNLDYYRKGGSIPEGMINMKPMITKDGVPMQMSQEQLEAMQRQLQAILTGDFTQVPIVTGGEISWIDFKGKRRDMQFKELAEYVAKKICAVYQVSPQDIAMLDGFKTSDGKVQSELTKSKGLRTLMTMISEYITNEVIEEIRPEGDLKLWFEDDDVDRQNEMWKLYQQQLSTGTKTINEVRAELGLHPVAWGYTPLQNLMKNWQPPQDPAMGGPAGPGLPPLPGITPPPAAGPGAGGSETPLPPIGGSPQDIAKSLLLGEYYGSEFDTTDYSYVSGKYIEEVREKNHNLGNLNGILTYDPQEYQRNTVDSIKHLATKYNIDVVVKNVDYDDVLMPAYLDGETVILDNIRGETPAIELISSEIARKALSPSTTVEEVKEEVLKSVDAPYRRKWYDFFKFLRREKKTYDVDKVQRLLK